jgi:hypothetical protein
MSFELLRNVKYDDGSLVTLMVCDKCGAVVPSTLRIKHDDWHVRLWRTAQEASHADMLTRVIG